MVQLSGPCSAGYSPVEIINAIGVAINLCLITFLARRRVRKDEADDARWSSLQPHAEERRKAIQKNNGDTANGHGP